MNVPGSRSTSSANFMFLVCIRRISRRPVGVGDTDVNLTIETTEPSQSGVDRVGSVG